MENRNIVQFIGFVTDLGYDEFMGLWEPASRELQKQDGKMTLQEILPGNNSSKFKFIVKIEYDPERAAFGFKGKGRTLFPDQKARVVDIGGYAPAKIDTKNNIEGYERLIVFIGHSERDISLYFNLPHRYMNIYEAWFESSVYGHILEFFVPSRDSELLLAQLKTRTGIESAIYRECPLVHTNTARQ
ncbi:MAG TPA: hypothetical protein VHM26_09615 [Chitinophagaceae bacterium]|jgi:hypothetical protein|nr:hypothetical protein [Chitinophagaceae bacterium]